jgi:hypothetical protein
LAQSEGQEAFKSYVEAIGHGVWTTTVDGATVTASYRQLKNNPFIQLTVEGNRLPYFCVIGVEPQTKKCTWWFFNNDGSTGKDLLTQEADGVWLLEGTGTGPKGEIRYKGRLKRVDANTSVEEVIELVIYGERQEPRTNTWKRTGQE